MRAVCLRFVARDGSKWPLVGVHKQDLDRIFPWRIRCGGNAPVLYWTAHLRTATYHDERKERSARCSMSSSPPTAIRSFYVAKREWPQGQDHPSRLRHRSITACPSSSIN